MASSLQMRRTAPLRSNSKCQNKVNHQYSQFDNASRRYSGSSSTVGSPELSPSGSCFNINRDETSPLPELNLSPDLKMLENVLLARLPDLSMREYVLVLDFFQSVPYAEYYLPIQKFAQVVLLHDMNYVLYYLISRIVAAALATASGNIVLEGGYPELFIDEAKEYLSIQDPLSVSNDCLYQEWELQCISSAQLLQVYCNSLIPLN